MKEVFKQKIEKRSTELVIIAAVFIVVGAAAQASDVLDAGNSSNLVAEYRFEEGGGQTAYDVNGTNDGTINGASWTDGRNGEALSFDGNDDYVQIPDDNSLEGMSGLTISTWVRHDSLSGDQDIVVKGTHSSNEPLVFWRDGGRSAYAALVTDNNNDYSDVKYSDFTPKLNEWTHVVITFEGNQEMRMFINGKEDANSPFSTPNVDEVKETAEDLYIGTNNNFAKYFDGSIDSTRIYSKSLNQSQIKSLYNQGSWTIGAENKKENVSKILEMNFQNQNSTHVYDTSRYNNHGRPQNSASQQNAWNCKVGRCYGFDENNDDHITISDDSSFDVGRTATLSAWIKPTEDTLDSNNHRFISTQSSSVLWYLRIQNGDELAASFRDADSNRAIATYSSNLEAGKWYHVVGKLNNDTIKLYKNGRQVGSASFTPTSNFNPRDVLRISSINGGAEVFDGSIDQVSIYNTSLSKEDIWSLYSQGRDRTEAGGMGAPIAHYPMQVESSPVRDISGEGNHGNISLLGESGTLNTSNGEWKEIRFNRSYNDPIVLGTTNTKVGESAIYFETRDVKSHKAEMRLCESEGGDNDGCDAHGTERAGYVVIDKANIDDVPGIDAGSFRIDSDIDSVTNTVSYSESFSNTPMVFTQVMTDNGRGEVESWPTSTDSSGFTAGICQQDSTNGCDSSHPEEEVGWVAIEPGNEPFEQQSEADNLSNEIGASNWGSTFFGSSFSEKPVGLFSVQNNDGGQDPKVDEIRNLNSSYMEMRFCELETGDNCDGHIDMEYAYFAAEKGLLTYTNGNYPRYIDIDGGKALQFDGTDDHVNVGDREKLETDSISVSMKVEHGRLEGDFECLICHEFSGRWSIKETDTNEVRFRVSPSGGSKAIYYPSPSTTDFKHYTMTYDAENGEFKVYINGELIETKTSSGILGSTTEDLVIGSTSAKGQRFDGKIKDVRLYPYALSHEDVKEVYNGGGISMG